MKAALAVLYLANASSAEIRASMASGELGQLVTPAEGKSPAKARYWAADNGCFGVGYPGDAGYLRWLTAQQPWAGSALFATAPDVPGDAIATLERSQPFWAALRARGFKAALVAQNGMNADGLPWSEIDAVFLGGMQQCGDCGWVRAIGEPVPALCNVAMCPHCRGTLSEWKVSRPARQLTLEAKRRGLWVHMGRVNSEERLREAAWMGVDSVDGTYLAFGPDRNLRQVRRWLRELPFPGPLRSPAAVEARTQGQRPHEEQLP